MKDKEWACSVADRIYEKVKITAERNRGKIPYTTINGVFDDWSDRISWWTNGFYAGQLWQLYHAYGGELFRKEAEKIEEKLDQSLMDYMGMDHDSGFKWLLTSVANYKLTGSQGSRNRALLAAANLAGRYNMQGEFIRAWNNWGEENQAGWVIIDCMMNLPLLYWASKEIDDPRFAFIAQSHADTVMKHFVRKDGSVHHIVRFKPETGEMIEPLGGQGMCVGSSWTRGQGWALYGFALSYAHTGNELYLDTAKRVARYFIESMPASGFVPVDFCQPADCQWEDSTAAAIAACGMLEIAKHTHVEEEKTYFYDAAVKLLKQLEEHRCNWSLEQDNIVEKCTAAYHDEGHNYSIIYGDYYFTEAIFKLSEKELFMW